MREYDDHEKHIAVLTNWQRRFNDLLREQIRYRPLLPPLTRWEKRKRRIASRWSRVRCRVALWIAPELDEY